jgi:hypothetical protein
MAGFDGIVLLTEKDFGGLGSFAMAMRSESGGMCSECRGHSIGEVVNLKSKPQIFDATRSLGNVQALHATSFEPCPADAPFRISFERYRPTVALGHSTNGGQYFFPSSSFCLVVSL